MKISINSHGNQNFVLVLAKFNCGRIMTTVEAESPAKQSDPRIWMTRNVLLLGLVSFFADLSSEMMTPVLPLYIAALGGTNVIIGFIGGLGDAVANIVQVFSGYLADRTGKRDKLIAFGYGVPFFAKLGIGLSSAWEQIMILKPTERLGKGIRGAPRDSLLSDSIPFEFRGKAFGFHRMMDTAGAIFGSLFSLIIVLLAFHLLENEIGLLKLIIIFSAFISLLAVIPILFLSEPKESVFKTLTRKTTLLQNLKIIPKEYYKFLLVSILFGLANFTILLFIIHAKTVILEIDDSTSAIIQITVPIALFIWFNIIYTALSIPFGSWSDKYGRKMIFAIGMCIFIITCLGFIFATNVIFLILFFGTYGAFYAATDGIQKAFAVDLLPQKQNLKGTGIGLLQTLVGFAGIVSGIIAGFLYDIDSSLAFLYGATVASIALLSLIAIKLPPSNLDDLYK
jgi:MFS family permease